MSKGRVSLTYLRDAIEHAPQASTVKRGPVWGWTVSTTDARNVHVCGLCVARIHARGCTIGKAAPMYDASADTCVLCQQGA